jgi:hypothetical protein
LNAGLQSGHRGEIPPLFLYFSRASQARDYAGVDKKNAADCSAAPVIP